MKKRRVVVNDLMQKNYIYWPVAPVGRNFHLPESTGHKLTSSHLRQ
jgi:hypothetical protein